MFGRLWLIDNRDDIYASDALDFDNYDSVAQLFSVMRGNGDELTALVPFKKNYIVAFKKKSVSFLSGVNEFVDLDNGDTLAQHVTIDTVSTVVGCIGAKAFAVHGEQISFLSYKGITSISRSSEGEMRGLDIPLSAPIQPLIDRINWDYAHNSVATYFDNYLMFSVPMDSSEVNNRTLVYDLLANGGQGAWVSEWDSDMLEPLEYFIDDEKLYFLNVDGSLKIHWSDDPWDSEDVFDDSPAYSASLIYQAWERVYYAVDGEDRIYRCLIECKGIVPTNTTYWIRETDEQHIYDVDAEIWTRFYIHGDEASPKRLSRCQVIADHQNPKLSLHLESEGYGTVTAMFEDVTYDQTAYDIAGKTAWDDSNWAHDFSDPYRQDYTILLDTAGRQWTIQELSDAFTMGDITTLGIPVSGIIDGMFMGLAGLDLNVYERHALRFIPRLVDNTSFSLRVRNKSGKFKLKSIICEAQQSLFAKRNI